MKVNTREFLSLSVETKDSIVEDIIGLFITRQVKLVIAIKKCFCNKFIMSL